MSRIKETSLICLAILLLGCSRSPQPPHAPPAAKSKASNTVVSNQITEKQALALLVSELKARKISDLDCLAFVAENDIPVDSRADLWQFAAREIHNKKCGGDPTVSPVRDRYQVNSAGKVWVYDAANDEYMQLKV